MYRLRCLVTLDLDFGNLLEFKPADCPGLAVVRLGSSPVANPQVALSTERLAELPILENESEGSAWLMCQDCVVAGGWVSGSLVARRALVATCYPVPPSSRNSSGRIARSANWAASTAASTPSAISGVYAGPPGYRATVPPSESCCRMRGVSADSIAACTSWSSFPNSRSILCVYSNA